MQDTWDCSPRSQTSSAKTALLLHPPLCARGLALAHALRLYWMKASTGDWDEGEPETGEPVFDVAWHWDALFAVLENGKSTTVMVAVEKAQAVGARVVLACPTRMLVAAYRQKYPDLDVDSVHAVFQLFRPEHETLLSMATYDLVVLDEVSQISAAVFERLLRLWEAAGHQPALVFFGDFAQLKAKDSPFWSTVFKFELRTMRRCRCPTLRWKLELLRVAKPSAKQLSDILRGHRAPSRQNRETHGPATGPPSEADVRAVFAEDPSTVFVTITKAAAADINDIAVASFFPDQAPLAVVPGDPDANPANFRGQEAWDPAPGGLGSSAWRPRPTYEEHSQGDGLCERRGCDDPWPAARRRACPH